MYCTECVVKRSLSQEWNGRSDRQYVLSTYCSVTLVFLISVNLYKWSVVNRCWRWSFNIGNREHVLYVQCAVCIVRTVYSTCKWDRIVRTVVQYVLWCHTPTRRSSSAARLQVRPRRQEQHRRGKYGGNTLPAYSLLHITCNCDDTDIDTMYRTCCITTGNSPTSSQRC